MEISFRWVAGGLGAVLFLIGIGMNLEILMWGGGGLVLIAGPFYAYIFEWRYKTPQLQTGTVHGSIDLPEYKSKNDKFRIFPLGSYKAMGMFSRGGEGTVIVPTESVQHVGGGAVSYSNPELVEENDLPMELREQMEGADGIKEPFWFAETCEGVNVDMKQVTDREFKDIDGREVVNALKVERRRANLYRDQYRKTSKDYSSEVAQRIGEHKAISSGGIRDSLKKAVMSDDNDR